MSTGDSMLVAGALARRASCGGHAWAIRSWHAGLRRLGYDVAFVDSSDPRSATASRANGGPGAGGAGEPRIAIDLMGDLGRSDGHVDMPHRAVFVDIDPGYPQMWRALGLVDMFGLHDRFVTIGENLGKPGCSIPDCGLDWITTPPPVLLDAWARTAGGTAFTTVATWRNAYGTVTYDGVTYGSRVHEFRKFMELPRLVNVEFELALDIDAAEVRDLQALEANGWRLVDPRAVAGTPTAYRSYVQGSRAEFCVAQNMYVATRSGWLSDRSLCYLASGKPVLAQDTGFSENYPVGEGLLAFSTVEEAAAGVEEIERNYDRHSRAARALAEEYFDSDRVLSRLLERLAITSGG